MTLSFCCFRWEFTSWQNQCTYQQICNCAGPWQFKHSCPVINSSFHSVTPDRELTQSSSSVPQKSPWCSLFQRQSVNRVLFSEHSSLFSLQTSWVHRCLTARILLSLWHGNSLGFSIKSNFHRMAGHQSRHSQELSERAINFKRSPSAKRLPVTLKAAWSTQKAQPVGWSSSSSAPLVRHSL